MKITSGFLGKATAWLVVLLLTLALVACSSMEEKRNSFMTSGQELYQKGDYVRAALQFKNALQIDPKFAAAQMWLGKTELKLHHFRQAYGALIQATELQPGLTEAQVLLGGLLLMARQLDKARAKAEIALKQEPQNADALMLSASLDAVDKQPQKALATLATVRRLDPSKVPAYILAATILDKEKKPEEAAAILDQGLKANPKDLSLYVARAGLADSQKKFQEGETFLLKGIEVNPKETRLYIQLVRHYLKAQQMDKAEETLRRVISQEPDNEKPVIMLARFLVRQGKRQEAEKVMQTFVKAHPDNYAARFALVEFYVFLRRPMHAQKELETIIAKDPEGPKGLQAKNQLARLKLSLGQTEAAGKLVAEILKTNPKDMQATQTRGIIALGQKDGLTAVTSFRLFTQDRPQDPEAWLLLARANLLNKEPALAKENAKRALQLKPDYIPARKFLYGMFIQAKDYDGLINTIKGYLRINDKDVFNLVALGDAYALKGDYSQSQNTFKKIIDLEPKNPAGYYQLARLAVKTKKLNDALKYANQALKAQADFFPALQLIVMIHLDQKHPDKALAVVRQAVADNPKNPRLQQLLGELLLVQKQPQAAVAPLEEALKLNPRQVSSLRLLALAYQQMPHPEKAIKELEEKVANPKTSPILALVLATVYERQNKFDQAITLYNSLLARNLFTSLARNNLAYLMAAHQPTPENLARAQKLAEDALADHPEEPSFLDTMGWVLCQRGKYAQAKSFLEKAVERFPGQPAMLYHLAWCEAKLGETAAARDNLEKALDSKAKFEQRDAAQKLRDSLPATGK
jgi:tetratricopeptide (TPR) repeat protein